MKRSKLAIASLAIVGTLALAGCGQSGTPDSGSGSSGGAPEYTVASDVKLSDSPTLTKAQEAGKIKVGMAFDAPGLSYKGTTDDVPAGYNAEIAKLVAAGLGFEPDQIEYVETVSKNREPFLQNGQVDLVVSSYTINDNRKKVVGFAGPYYHAGQDLLVKIDNDDIKSKNDLAGKTVCAPQGSTPAQNIEENFPDTQLVTYDGNSKCLSDVESGNVDAMTTDDIVLRGFAAANEGKYKVVGDPFTDEPYGVGVPHDDTALRSKINDILEGAAESGSGELKKAWEYAFGSADGYQDPDVDRY